jgi:2-methylcitrate dehydratase PrpD
LCERKGKTYINFSIDGHYRLLGNKQKELKMSKHKSGGDAIVALSENIVSTRFEDIPDSSVESARFFILDTFGTALAGSSAPGVKSIVELVNEIGGKPESSLWVPPGGTVLPATAAAFANGVMAHARDFDDTHDAAIVHANTSVLPAAFAMAEKRQCSGKDLICAVVLGVDLACRMGLAAPSLGGWIHSSTLAYFGSAAASAKLAGLEFDQIVNAMGIVYSQVAGNTQCLIEGALSKRMQPAFGARGGVFSTLLAERGVTGPREVLEGKYGFFHLYQRGNYSRERLLKDLGKHFEGINLSMKPYPCCRATHASIDTILQCLEEEPFTAEEVEGVTVEVPPVVMDFVGRPFEIGPSPQVSAQFSIPYTVATCILKREIFIGDFEDEAVISSPAIELARRILVVERDDVTDPKAFVPIRMEIRLKDGRKMVREAHQMKGSPDHPMTTDEVVEKFKKCNEYALNPLSDANVDALIEKTLAIENIADITEMQNLWN